MISKFFIFRPKFAFVVAIVIVLAGLVAIYSLPIAQYPQIVPPEVSVSTTYPGASASTVADTVTTPLEEQINGVENMIYFSSQSTDQGTCKITVSFDVGTDPDMNTVNVNNRVQTALSSLPEEVTKEGVTVLQESSEILLIICVYSESGKLDDTFLSNFTSINLLYPVERLPGVGQAEILGAQDYSMRIWLNPSKMASLKISAEEVISAIESQNVQVAAGLIGGPPTKGNQSFQYTVETQGRLTSVKQFENIIVRSSPTGAYVKIRDIAKVELGAFSYSAYGQINNKPAALLAVFQLADANALATAEAVKKTIKELSKSFPKDIKANILYDTTKFVTASVNEVVKTLFIAVILVIIVTYIFLQDLRTVLIPTIAIPVSLIGTFAVLLALGYSINLITLLGLILAIGIVVDDAIVVTENVHRLMESENLDPTAATLKSMEQVTPPIIATTMVLLATFVPVAFVPGISGELYRQFAVTIVVSVCISAFNALTLSPALCVTLLTGKTGKKFIFFVWFNRFFDFLSNQYNRTVSFLIRRLSIVVIFFLLLLVAMYLVYDKIPTGFIPNEDQGAFFVNVQLPSGASLNRTGTIMRKISDIVQKTDGVVAVQDVIGYSIVSQTTSSNVGFATGILKDWSERTTPELQLDYILAKLNAQFQEIAGASISAFGLPPIPGLGVSGGFEYELQQKEGSDSKALASSLNSLIAASNQSPVLDGVYSTYRANVPKVYLNIDREKAEKLGVTIDALNNTIQAYLGSMYINQFNKFGQVYKVMIQVSSQFRDKIQDIYNLYVLNKDKKRVQLSTLLKAKTVLGPNIVTHYNMLNTAEVFGNPAPGYSSGEAITEMERISKEELPDNMTYSWTSTAYQEILAGNLIIIIFALAITFIYLFLVAQYESWLIAFAVILSVPVAIFGALIALWITGIDNNIYAQIGFALLFGMASKTAILIVEFAKEQRDGGKPILEAAEMAAKLRFRAVVMTSVAFILGVFPLVIATGASSNSRRSLGTAVFGGMLMAAVLGTVIIPVFYVILQKVIEREWGAPKANKDEEKKK